MAETQDQYDARMDAIEADHQAGEHDQQRVEDCYFCPDEAAWSEPYHGQEPPELEDIMMGLL